MTKLIGFGRCLGKTTMAILESHATGNQIICANNRMVKITSSHAKQLGYAIPQPVSINNPSLKEIINTLNRAHIGVVVDNVEMVLQSLLGCQIDTITFDSPNVTNVVDRYEEEIEDLKKELAACYREKEEDQGIIKKLRSICISQQEVIMDYEWDKMHRAAIAKKCNRRRFAR